MKVVGGNGIVKYLIALYENTIDAILLVKFGAKKKQCVEEQRSNKKLGLTWAGRMAGLSGIKIGGLRLKVRTSFRTCQTRNIYSCWLDI